MSYNICKSRSQKSHYFHTPRRTTLSKFDSSYIFRIQETQNFLKTHKTSIDKENTKKQIHLLGIK